MKLIAFIIVRNDNFDFNKRISFYEETYQASKGK
jgi:hypothetical protein